MTNDKRAAPNSTLSTEHSALAALRRAVATLRFHGIEEPELEAEVLLRHVLQLDRAYLILRLPDALGEDQVTEYQSLVAKRVAHVPTAYLTERREFYSLSFAVGPGVLIPRPETERLVETAIAMARATLKTQGRASLVDVGTGSGAIALSIAKHVPALRVLATDISPAALAIADLNAKRLRLAGRVTFLLGDLLAPVAEPVDLIVANLPYIPSSMIDGLAPEIRDYEPRVALDGGPDGLRLIDRLLSDAAWKLNPDGAMILEIQFDQAAAVSGLVQEHIPSARVEILKDLARHDRIAVIHL